MKQQIATIGGKKYTVEGPYNSQDMNFHFIDDVGNDYLVDMGDVMDWYELEFGVSIQQAINFANEINDYHECDWYWKIK